MGYRRPKTMATRPTAPTSTGTTTPTIGAGGHTPHDYAATTAAGQGQGVYGHDYDRKEQHGVTGVVLHRSGSSSSSPSEDDGLGGRRKKKGLKEKLPSGARTDTTYGGTGTTGQQHHQEKGMMDKIKEKLSGTGGHRADDPYSSHTHTTPTTTPYGGTAYTEEHHEKMGIMDKIKEKLPGQH